jgi:putative hydrolase of the HAD superfamily
MILPESPYPYEDTQAVLFDLDGTLRHNDPDANNTLFDFVVTLGAQDSPTNRQRASRWAHYYWAHSPEMQEDVLVHHANEADFWENYTVRKLQVFGCSEALALKLAPQVREYMSEHYQPQDRILPEAAQVLSALQAQGYVLGLITNRSQPVDAYLEEVDLAAYFDLILAAGEIQIFKPDPGIFTFALEKLGIHSARALYVGDNYYADIVGARKASVRPVLYDREGIFNGADCTTITQLDELLGVLQPA